MIIIKDLESNKYLSDLGESYIEWDFDPWSAESFCTVEAFNKQAKRYEKHLVDCIGYEDEAFEANELNNKRLQIIEVVH